MGFILLVRLQLRKCIRCEITGAMQGLEGEMPAAFTARVAAKPALAAKDSRHARGHRLAAPAAHRDHRRTAEKVIPRWMNCGLVEAVTTVAVGEAFHG